MPAFDTSALIPLFVEGHQKARAAKAAFLAADRAYIHPCIALEFTMVVRRIAKDAGKDGNMAARKAFSELMASPHCSIRTDVDVAATEQRFLETPQLSYADAVLAATTWGGVITGDRALAKIVGSTPI